MKRFNVIEGYPLYRQVYKWMKDNIESGHWEVGMKLPSEPALSRDIGVSRSTLRLAIRLLIDDGICYQRPGKGTFITSKRTRYELTDLKSFTEQMKAKNIKPTSKLLELSTNLIPSEHIQLKLGLSPNDRVRKIKRIRYADDLPMSLETVYMGVTICSGIEKYDFAKESIYNLVEDTYKIPIINGVLSIESDEANREDAKYLKVETGTSMLYVDAINYTENEKPVFITFAKYPKDRYTFTINMSRRYRD